VNKKLEKIKEEIQNDNKKRVHIAMEQIHENYDNQKNKK